MKQAFYFTLILFLFFVSVGVTNQVFFSNTAVAEQSLVSNSIDGNTSKATLSNDLKVAYEQTDNNATTGSFFSNNWGKLLAGLLAFGELVVRLTPSVKDNSILNFITTIVNGLIPNLRKEGGVF